MSGDEKREFGDYQTPLDFCYSVCNYIYESGLAQSVQAIVEPTCGIGNFMIAASNTFEHKRVFGIDINAGYVDIAKKEVPSAIVKVDNIFDVNVKELCGSDNVLIVGNPPWATNSALSFNLPKKVNFKGLRGIDALTGSSNFDICEYVILKLLDEYKSTDSTICMLCKTSVARNVILEMSRNHIVYEKVEILNFNSSKVFGVSASACIFVVKLCKHGENNGNVVCDVKNFDDKKVVDTLTANCEKIKTATTKIDLDGKCQLSWRQGVKHDCGRIMELDLIDGKFVNKNKEVVSIENGLVFPLVKSSHFKRPIIHDFKKYVIVTQTKAKQDTSYIEAKYPLTWHYLNDNIDSFNGRKSIIYKKSAPFSMFGIGDYSFAPYKVGLSGFYKKPLFCLLYSDKPVMTDDTAYFLAFDDYNIAYGMMLLLNSKTVQDFLLSIAFLDNKRPYTVKLLSRLDIKKCMEVISFKELQQTETDLLLVKHITREMYNNLLQFIAEKS